MICMDRQCAVNLMNNTHMEKIVTLTKSITILMSAAHFGISSYI